ncbi:MAG: hypothetical protein Q8M23_02975, partial [Bacteroidales bacterium]|nr:hypothetical protein [Bacteroidales bacterium]
MFRNKSIAFKLTIYILSGIILIFSTIVFLNYSDSRKIILRNVEQNAVNLGQSTVLKIENVLYAAEKIPLNLSPIIESSAFFEQNLINFLKPIV